MFLLIGTTTTVPVPMKARRSNYLHDVTAFSSQFDTTDIRGKLFYLYVVMLVISVFLVIGSAIMVTKDDL